MEKQHTPESIPKEALDPSFPYGDILYCSRIHSLSHPPMPRENRAAQFAPFAALTGLDAAMEKMAEENYRHMEYDPVETIDGEVFRTIDRKGPLS